MHSLVFATIFLPPHSRSVWCSKMLELFVLLGSLCLKLVCEDTREEQLEGIDRDVVCGSLHIGVVLED